MTKTYYTPMLQIVGIISNNIITTSPGPGFSTENSVNVENIGSAGRRFDDWDAGY